MTPWLRKSPPVQFRVASPGLADVLRPLGFSAAYNYSCLGAGGGAVSAYRSDQDGPPPPNQTKEF